MNWLQTMVSVMSPKTLLDKNEMLSMMFFLHHFWHEGKMKNLMQSVLSSFFFAGEFVTYVYKETGRRKEE